MMLALHFIFCIIVRLIGKLSIIIKIAIPYGLRCYGLGVSLKIKWSRNFAES